MYAEIDDQYQAKVERMELAEEARQAAIDSEMADMKVAILGQTGAMDFVRDWIADSDEDLSLVYKMSATYYDTDKTRLGELVATIFANRLRTAAEFTVDNRSPE